MTQSLGFLCGIVVAVPLLLWLSCRLSARACPRCGSWWRTELVGEFAGEEDWTCHRCLYQWSHPMIDEPDDEEPASPDDFPDSDDEVDTLCECPYCDGDGRVKHTTDCEDTYDRCSHCRGRGWY